MFVFKEEISWAEHVFSGLYTFAAKVVIVIPTELNTTYFQATVYKIAALISEKPMFPKDLGLQYISSDTSSVSKGGIDAFPFGLICAISTNTFNE